MYALMAKQLPHVLEGEKNFISNCANFSSLVFNSLDNLNWAGFYFMKRGELILGPFQGKTACVRIPVGKGVCGTAAAERQTVVVPDVHEFPGHIACDAASQAEIVIPLFNGDKVIGVLDIDSPVKNRFSQQDAAELEKLAAILLGLSDMEEFAGWYK